MRNEQKFGIVIGKNTYNEYVFLDGAFRYDDGFKGLTGFTCEIIDEDDRDRRIGDFYTSENLDYIWKDAVANDITELGLDERIKQVRYDDEFNGCECGIDNSYTNVIFSERNWNIINENEGLGESYDYYSDCCGGGRMFDDKMLNDDYWKWKDKENFELFKKLYKEYEKDEK